ncbi:hypothetical protein AOQ71_38395 [Bradyrhizobium manausense]|uniref:Uncharacterized protein n=1 Tax=Bradyrhizobium manausense TaxID=989370 RepID=A0A0R3CT04_9BRAD|nr:hypothetical protein AOQ71_38395 [Bradyrhizobium manausense]
MRKAVAPVVTATMRRRDKPAAPAALRASVAGSEATVARRTSRVNAPAAAAVAALWGQRAEPVARAAPIRFPPAAPVGASDRMGLMERP